jgi:hypothetical protein
MRRCPECGFGNKDTAKLCADCGADLSAPPKQKAGQFSGRPSTEAEQLRLDVQTARHEQRRYKLDPQRPGEADREFCQRIEREKTPAVLADLNRIYDGLHGRNKP